jgi:hypothetical protein
MKMMTPEEIIAQCPRLKRNIERASLWQYWGKYLSSYDPDNSDILKDALEYAAHGWQVFPCSPVSKKPLTTNGLYAATTNAEMIKQFWRQNPTAMIGVACGPKSGVWCLDPDAPTEKNPIDGRAEWSLLNGENGGVEPTHTHITPGGGNHLIFKWRTDRAPITNREGALKGKHINVRGEGGYFIACGSVNADGVGYTMADQEHYFKFAPASDWLHEMIEGKQPPQAFADLSAADQARIPNEMRHEKDRTDNGHRTIIDRALDPVATRYLNVAASCRTGNAYARSALNKESAELAITSIDRNIRLNNAAISLGRFVKSGELTESEVVEALVKASEANGYDQEHGRTATLKTIKSGMGAATARIKVETAKSEPLLLAQQPQQARGWPFKHAKDFRTEINKLWIIKGVIAPGEISNWCGTPKSGKSALVGDLALHVCAGLDWCGYRSKQSGGVVYFALERADLVERRWNAQAAQYGLCPEALPFAVVNWTIDMIHPSCVADFVATIRAAEDAMGVPVKMIVIDTSAKAIAAGGGDENQAKDKNVMRANVRRVMLAIEGLHVALISHTGKDVDKGERGSNAGLGDDDVFIQLDGKLADVKQRNDGATGPLTAYTVKGVVLGVDEDGDTVDIGIIDPDTGAAAAKAKAGKRDRQKLTNPQRLALTALERAIIDHGKPMPVGSDYPKGIATCTSLDHWRGVFKSLSDPEGNPDTVLTAFRRAQGHLKVECWIGVWEGNVWLAYD